MAGRGEGIDAAAADVDGERARGLAGGDDEMAVVLDHPEGVEVLAAAVGELHVADGDGGGAGGMGLHERLQADDPLHRGHEMDGNPAVDPGDGHGRELELVGQHGPVAAQEVHDQVHSRRGVGDERDLLRLRAHERGHARADLLPALHPRVPLRVAPLLQLAVEALDGEADGRGRQAGGGRVEVDAPLQGGEVLPHLVPREGHPCSICRRWP